MKNYLVIILLLTLASCTDNSGSPDINIEGKWNLAKYTDIDGIEYQSTYIIFMWYEQGFEFVDAKKFYPRYDPESRHGSDEWLTDYSIGPGNYVVTDNKLTLSFEDQIYDYVLHVIDENTIELSNKTAGQNPWTGTWVLVKNN